MECNVIWISLSIKYLNKNKSKARDEEERSLRTLSGVNTVICCDSNESLFLLNLKFSACSSMEGSHSSIRYQEPSYNVAQAKQKTNAFHVFISYLCLLRYPILLLIQPRFGSQGTNGKAFCQGCLIPEFLLLLIPQKYCLFYPWKI